MNAIVLGGAPPRATAVESLGGQHLTFLLKGGVYGIALTHIREIIEFGALTEVPRMPEFVRGVMNLRGSVLPVVDLGARLGLGASQSCRKTCVVILDLAGESSSMLVGAMVDAVCEVVEVQHADVQKAPDFGSSVDARYMQGMVRSEDRFMILLDVSTAMSLKEMARLVETMDQQ